jgi:hypothetical protein
MKWGIQHISCQFFRIFKTLPYDDVFSWTDHRIIHLKNYVLMVTDVIQILVFFNR